MMGSGASVRSGDPVCVRGPGAHRAGGATGRVDGFGPRNGALRSLPSLVRRPAAPRHAAGSDDDGTRRWPQAARARTGRHPAAPAL